MEKITAIEIENYIYKCYSKYRVLLLDTMAVQIIKKLVVAMFLCVMRTAECMEVKMKFTLYGFEVNISDEQREDVKKLVRLKNACKIIMNDFDKKLPHRKNKFKLEGQVVSAIYASFEQMADEILKTLLGLGIYDVTNEDILSNSKSEIKRIIELTNVDIERGALVNAVSKDCDNMIYLVGYYCKVYGINNTLSIDYLNRGLEILNNIRKEKFLTEDLPRIVTDMIISYPANLEFYKVAYILLGDGAGTLFDLMTYLGLEFEASKKRNLFVMSKWNQYIWGNRKNVIFQYIKGKNLTDYFDQFHLSSFDNSINLFEEDKSIFWSFLLYIEETFRFHTKSDRFEVLNNPNKYAPNWFGKYSKKIKVNDGEIPLCLIPLDFKFMYGISNYILVTNYGIRTANHFIGLGQIYDIEISDRNFYINGTKLEVNEVTYKREVQDFLNEALLSVILILQCALFKEYIPVIEGYINENKVASSMRSKDIYFWLLFGDIPLFLQHYENGYKYLAHILCHELDFKYNRNGYIDVYKQNELFTDINDFAREIQVPNNEIRVLLVSNSRQGVLLTDKKIYIANKPKILGQYNINEIKSIYYEGKDLFINDDKYTLSLKGIACHTLCRWIGLIIYIVQNIYLFRKYGEEYVTFQLSGINFEDRSEGSDNIQNQTISNVSDNQATLETTISDGKNESSQLQIDNQRKYINNKSLEFEQVSNKLKEREYINKEGIYQKPLIDRIGEEEKSSEMVRNELVAIQKTVNAKLQREEKGKDGEEFGNHTKSEPYVQILKSELDTIKANTKEKALQEFREKARIRENGDEKIVKSARIEQVREKRVAKDKNPTTLSWLSLVGGILTWCTLGLIFPPFILAIASVVLGIKGFKSTRKIISIIGIVLGGMFYALIIVALIYY